MADSVDIWDVDNVIITGDLDRRPSRAPDYEAESHAFMPLVEMMSRSPDTVLQRLVEITMELTHAGSAGISLLEPGGVQGIFRWIETAGVWAPYRNTTIARADSPCGEVIARETILLMKHPARVFPALLQAQPGIIEELLAPFPIDRKPAGTIWAIKHDPDDQFDPEDARIMVSLARFASAAHQVLLARSGAEAGMQKSDDRFLALAAASSEMLYTLGPDWDGMHLVSGLGFLAQNPGLSRGRFIDHVPEDDQPGVTAAIAAATSGKDIFELEHRVYLRDGSIGWASSRAVPILGADDEIVEWFGAANEVTKRKHAEADLRDIEARQRFLLELSDALRSLCTPAEIKELVVARLGKQFGLSRVFYGEIIGTELLVENDHTCGVHSLVGAQSLEAFSKDFLAAYWAGAVITVRDVNADERLSKDARAVLRERKVAAFVDVVLFEEGRCVSLLAVQSSTPRNWSPEEESLFREVGERLKAAIERARGEGALRESEERFRQFSDASTSTLWIRRADNLDMEFASPAFDILYGLPGPDRDGDPSLKAWAALIVAEDRHAVIDNFRRVCNGERVEQEFRIKRKTEGALRWVQDTGFPLRDSAGRVRWIAGVGTDITDAKEAAGRQNVLIAELQHRTRNLIAVVHSLSNRTLANSGSLEDFGKRFGLRLAALSRVQGLLSHLAAGERVTFDELVRAELAAHGATSELAHKITLVGPSHVPLRSGTVQTFALAIHELATNALKYGALASPDGHLTVLWHVEAPVGDDPPNLHVEWLETRVTMAEANAPPRGGGYGRELIERALPYQLSAKTSYELTADGVRCFISVPISRTGSQRRLDEA